MDTPFLSYNSPVDVLPFIENRRCRGGLFRLLRSAENEESSAGKQSALVCPLEYRSTSIRAKRTRSAEPRTASLPYLLHRRVVGTHVSRIADHEQEGRRRGEFGFIANVSSPRDAQAKEGEKTKVRAGADDRAG